MENILKNPFRLFFPLGLIGLIIGLGVWIHFAFNTEVYWGRTHAHLMIGIFLLNFVVGFLMTAIPRMSSGPGATTREVNLQLFTLLITFYFAFYQEEEKYFFFSVLASLLVLFIFCFKRIFFCKFTIPDVFPMVLTALFSGIVGAIFFINGQQDIGNRLFYVNLILALCVGVGAKLIPMITGNGCSGKYFKAEFWIIGLILTLSCFLESFFNETFGSILRNLVMIVVFFRYWRAHRFSGVNTSVSLGVRIASVSILLGTLGLTLFPDYRLESLHILFISGFSLLTIMVASRVILAHGNHGLNLEIKNWFIRFAIFFIVLAASTRVSAIFLEDSYAYHLAYAAIMFICGMAFWGHYFIPKLIKPASPKN